MAYSFIVFNALIIFPTDIRLSQDSASSAALLGNAANREDSCEPAAVVVVAVHAGAEALLHTITSTATGNAHLSPCTLDSEGKEKVEVLQTAP